MKTAKINGVVHDVLIEKLDGYCFKSGWQSSKPTMVVPIEPDNTKKFMEAIIHEFTHCHKRYMSEEEVTQYADDLARMLWRLGFRLDNNRSKP